MKKTNNNELDVANIQRKVIKQIKKPLKTLDDIRSFLTRWWCRHYNKPYKNSEIENYTIEELLYEYFDIYYHTYPEEADKFLNNKTADKKVQEEDEKWLKEQLGDNYISPEEQEKMLKNVSKELKEKDKKFNPDSMHIDFDDFK